MARITVIGAGSWGTALAIVANSAGHEVRLWSRDAAQAEEINSFRRNPRHLSVISIPKEIIAFSDLRSACLGAESLILAAPCQALRGILNQLAIYLSPEAVLINAAKGIEVGTGLRVSQIAKEVFSGVPKLRFVCLSGPSFAEEVVASQPTAVSAASGDLMLARQVQSELSCGAFRIYANNDLVGTETAGALKNIMAIAAGMLSGLGLGSNSLAALITRGLAEMSRFTVASGGQVETMNGLAGLGDLVLTCTGTLSRNRSLGYELGQGRRLAEVLSGLREVVEGVPTTRAVATAAAEMGVDMPITNAVNSVLYAGRRPEAAIQDLLTRPLKDEF
jgi:glycerol-3-phosphate dehydrogenase (NAD(P)+)